MRGPDALQRRVHFGSVFGMSVVLLLTNAPLSDQGTETGALLGIVWDSVRMAPLADAEVSILNTGFTGRTNIDGRFFIPNLPHGRYLVVFKHPRADSLPFPPAPVPVEIAAGTQTHVTLRLTPVIDEELTPAEVDSISAWLAELGVPVDSAVRSRIRRVAGEQADIHGVVAERSTRRPIGGALVEFRGAGFTSITDANGRFRFRNVPPRSYELRVSMLGYTEQTQGLDVAPGQRLDVRVDLSADPFRLDPIVVQVRSRTLDRVGFYQRKNDRATWGRFITSIDIQRQNLMETADLFHAIPGATVIYQGVGRRKVVFKRPSTTGPVCSPAMYVDGQPLSNALDVVAPAVIEGVEVYVGSTAPMEFGGAAGCGAILFWTKRGA